MNESILKDFPNKGILIDNSTLISMEGVINEKSIDPYKLYNLHTLIESIVLQDQIHFTFGHDWDPENTDNLLKEKIVNKIGKKDINTDHWKQIFRGVIEESKSDLINGRIKFALLKTSNFNVDKVTKIINNYEAILENNPNNFLSDIYPKIVIDADPYVEKFFKDKWRQDFPTHYGEENVAIYLLRTNLPYLLSQKLPYLPYSHRVSFITKKLKDNSTNEVQLSRDIIRKIEQKRNKSAEEVNIEFQKIRDFQKLDVDIPIILTAVLRDCSTIDDIIPSVLNLRKSKKAKLFREEIANINLNMKNMDQDKLVITKEKIDRISEELTEEYSIRKHKFIIRNSLNIGSLNAEKITDNLITSVINSGITNIFNRRFAFLYDLRKNTKNVGSINNLIEPLFGRKLSNDELQQFWSIKNMYP